MRITQHINPLLPVPHWRRKESAARNPGVHVSTAIKRILLALDPKRFGPRRAKGGPDLDLDTVPAIWLGQAVDMYLKSAMTDAGGQPVEEMEHEGIWLSSDLLQLHHEDKARPGLPDDPIDQLVVEEFKATWMSCRQPLTDPKFKHWLWQLMAYCWAWETCRGRLRVLYVNGDYGPPQPEFAVYDLLFTVQELDTNWQMIRRHAQ